ncbi:MAG: hypothetical protein ACI867_001342, partial [Glaciecola sp.]
MKANIVKNRRAIRLRSLLAASLVAPMLVPIALAPASAAAPFEGTIGGTVRDADGALIGGICVRAFDLDGNQEGTSSSTLVGDGSYNLSGLGVGSYRLRFRDCGNQYEPFIGIADTALSTVFAGIGGKVDVFDQSTSISIGDADANSDEGAPTSDGEPDKTLDVSLDQLDAVLSGNVQQDQPNAVALPDVCIQVLTTDGSVIAEVATSDNTTGEFQEGEFAFKGLPSDTSVKLFIRDDLANCGSLTRAFGIGGDVVDGVGGLNSHVAEYYQDSPSFTDPKTTTIDLVQAAAFNPQIFLSPVDQSRGLSGTVTADGDGLVAPGICVTSYDADGTIAAQTDTAIDGTFSMPLPAGDYNVEFHERCKQGSDLSPNDDVYVAEFWKDGDYSDDQAPTSISPALTVAGFTAPATAETATVDQAGFQDISAKIAKRGSIAGHVTDTAAADLAGVCVVALGGELAATDLAPNDITDSNGEYTITGLRPTDYTLRFLPEDGDGDNCPGVQGPADLVSEYFDDSNSRAGATPVVVGNGEAVVSRDAELGDVNVNHAISGTVKLGSDLVSGICVSVLTRDGDTVKSDFTDVNGSYSLPGLAPGEYVVRFARRDFPDPLGCDGAATTVDDELLYIATEYHNDSGTLEAASIVTVTNDDVTVGTTTVARGVRIGGTVTVPEGFTDEVCVELTLASGAKYRAQQESIFPFVYRFEGLTPDTYIVRFDDADPNGTCGADAFTSPNDRLQEQWFDRKATKSSASPIQLLQGGQERTSVNAALALTAESGTFSRLRGYTEDSNENPINGIQVDVFRTDQNPATDAPAFSTTTVTRTIHMAQRVCDEVKDPAEGDIERPPRCEDDATEVIAKTLVASGYWEVSDGAVGFYKVRYSDPKGLHATEWHDSQTTFASSLAIELKAGQDKEIGDRTEDRDNYEADITDDDDDRPAPFGSSADPGDTAEPDLHLNCLVPAGYEEPLEPVDCDLEALPVNDGKVEFITRLGTAGTVTGRVTAASNGAAVPGTKVELLEVETAAVVATASTGSDGRYTILGVASGIYIVKFSSSNPALRGEFFNNRRTFGEADNVNVAPGTTSSAVNASLEGNTKPVASADTVQAVVNETTVFSRLLSNDTDPEGDIITLKSVTQPDVHGSVVRSGDTVSFTPETDNREDTTFSYTIADESGLTSTATVTVNMVGQIIGDSPIANDDDISTARNTALLIYVLVNDSDPDGANSDLVIDSVGTPFHGAAVVVGETIRYTPTQNYSGFDQFSYTIIDKQGFTSSARVTVAVDASSVNGANADADAGETVATQGTTADEQNPIITSVTSPNAGQVSIVENDVPTRTDSNGTTFLTLSADIRAPNGTVGNPITITFRIDGSALLGKSQAQRSLRVLRNGSIVEDCLGSVIASPSPCISSHRMVGDDVLVTVRTTQASEWTFGFRDHAVVDRAAVQGAGRVDTAVRVARQAFSASEVDTVLIARSDTYPDALAGAPLAHSLGAPLLLTNKAALDAVTRDEILRLGASNIIILGGPNAVSTGVENTLRNISGVRSVRRIAGSNRFETATRVAAQLGGYRDAYVVEGQSTDPNRGWPDAVSVAGLAAFQGRPILLVNKGSIPAETRAALRGLSTATVVGGPGAVSTAVLQDIRTLVGSANRIAGNSRYETSYQVALVARDAGM